MPALDEARTQLINALMAWDFSPLFPTGYTNPAGVLVVKGWPFDILDNILAETNGRMTQPVVFIEVVHGGDNFRTLGGYMSGAPAGKQRIGTRVNPAFILGTCVDEQLGGSEMAESVAGYIQQCMFYNRNRLPAYRALKCTFLREVFQARPQLWEQDVLVEGEAVVSYDIPVL